MTIKVTKAKKKLAYDKKLCSLLDEYSQVLVAAADNVGSNQLQNNNAGITQVFHNPKREAHLRILVLKRKDHPRVLKFKREAHLRILSPILS